ncbi:MAG: hypothetical protein ACYTBZ_21125 [Planctomycetota bacterium]
MLTGVELRYSLTHHGGCATGPSVVRGQAGGLLRHATGGLLLNGTPVCSPGTK